MIRDLIVFGLYIGRRLKQVWHRSPWGYCLRCGRSWANENLQRHETWFGKKLPGTRGTYGVFPLCEECWTELGTTARRLPFYRRLFRKWKKSYVAEPHQWHEIEKAVEKDGA
jgi:hypothetical protein